MGPGEPLLDVEHEALVQKPVEDDTSILVSLVHNALTHGIRIKKILSMNGW